MAEEEILRSILAEDALNILRKKIEAEQASAKATNARAKAINRLAKAKEDQAKANNRRAANLEDVVQRYAHQGQQLELLLQTAPELVAAIFGIQEWLEELSERLDARFNVIERKLDTTLKLQEFLLAQVPDSQLKTKLTENLRDTIIMDATPPNQKVALQRRLWILTNTLNKLLEREAKQGGLAGADVSLETAIEDIQDKIKIVSAELVALSPPATPATPTSSNSG